MDDDDSVVIVGGSSENEFVSSEPSCQVLPVTFVPVDGDVAFSRVGSNEDESGVLVLDGGSDGFEGKVVEDRGDGGSVLSGLSLDSFEGLQVAQEEWVSS